MTLLGQPPAGPRGSLGAAAEDAAAEHLVRSGWSVLARNLRLRATEVDIVSVEPCPSPVLVVVEVRSASVPGFGSALETVDARKVARLYRAAAALARAWSPRTVGPEARARSWRVDLLVMRREPDLRWAVEVHLRGLEPP